MSAFTSPLMLRVWSSAELEAAGRQKQRYEVACPFVYESDLVGTITVPTGFLTDFASIPRPVWAILAPEDPVIQFPSVIHDFMYSVGAQLFARHQADTVLKEAMRVCGASPWQIAAVYRAVRLFGAPYWLALDRVA